MYEYSFVKGHGTENDFVLLPDAGGELPLDEDLVRRLCDRRAGVGGDGVIRVVRADATEDPAALEAWREFRREHPDRVLWFMDYRNADGSLAQMCGNGVRVFALYLLTHADVDPRDPLTVATRSGLRTLTVERDTITAEMGQARVLGATRVAVGERSWAATQVDVGNPHAVALVDDLAEAGTLAEPPSHDEAVFPDGVNVEFVTRLDEHHISMRVHERGSGETRSCGTGACAAVVAAATAAGDARPITYAVDVPGGQLQVTWQEDGNVLLGGPAVLVAEGVARL